LLQKQIKSDAPKKCALAAAGLAYNSKVHAVCEPICE
jgi:hypothetical protein